MVIMPTKEQPSLRDTFATHIAGVLLNKSGIDINTDLFYLRKVDVHTELLLNTVAFLSYRLADKLLEERVRKD
jgi:hypothetical protein